MLSDQLKKYSAVDDHYLNNPQVISVIQTDFHVGITLTNQKYANYNKHGEDISSEAIDDLMSMVLDAGDATTTPIGSSSSSDGNNQSVAAMNNIAYTSNVTINGVGQNITMVCCNTLYPLIYFIVRL